MSYFNLPISSTVNRFIPKNAFSEFAKAKHKRKFADWVDRITWISKLSKDTINLEGKEITEIQIFEIKLKEQVFPKELLDIIDRAIPYQIIFVLVYQDLYMLCTTKKHPHPLNENSAVLDWLFSSDWITVGEKEYALNLKISLDHIYSDFCLQLSKHSHEIKDINSLIEFDRRIKSLKKQIQELENALKNEKQFNRKVELNIELNGLKKELEAEVNRKMA